MEIETFELSYGENCKDNSAELTMKNLGTIIQIIREGRAELDYKTQQLRSVLKYSKERYTLMKTKLPFISCSRFEPARRSVQHFVEAIGLLIDIDYHSQMPDDLVCRLYDDQRVVFGYISPSGQGLKLFFLFNEPISDAITYKAFYKQFSAAFAQEYQLMDKVDFQNCDVSRICFLSHDPAIHHNPSPSFLDTFSFEVPTLDLAVPHTQSIEMQSKQPTENEYRQILAKLNTKPRLEKAAPIVPAKLLELIEPIKATLLDYEIKVKEIEPISYGLKIHALRHLDLGEINIYYGKGGFRIVTSPKKGTHPELNEMLKHIIEAIVVDY